MTHSELIKTIARKLELTPDEVAILWRETQTVLTKALQQKDKVRIKNFGSFLVVRHKSRTVPDPREMTKKLIIFDQDLPKFRPSEQLRAQVKDVMPAAGIGPSEADEISEEGEPTTVQESPMSPEVSTGSTSPAAETQADTQSTGPIGLTVGGTPLAAEENGQAQLATQTATKSDQPLAADSSTSTINSTGDQQPALSPSVATPTEATVSPTAGLTATTPTAPVVPAAEQSQPEEAKSPAKTKESKADKKSDLTPTTPSEIGFAELSNLTLDKEVLNLIPYKTAQKYQMVAIEKNDDVLTVAMIDPGDREATDLAGRQTGLTIKPKITTAADLEFALGQYETNDSAFKQLLSDTASDTDALTAKDEAVAAADESGEGTDAPAAKAVTTILQRAVREKASDIHIEPEEKTIVVRFRVDGILHKALELPKSIQPAITSRIKIMSSLKIDESRLPQDGRIRMTVDNEAIDFRLSTLPTVNGEKIVMRILDKSAGILTLEDLGLRGTNLKRVEDNITKSHGMLLVTGPTGSGKTTTLYSVIGKIIRPEINIITVEDPVEYRITGVNQSQVNSAIGYDFSSGLRSIVRQDPDVILIGEVRDLETATIAIQSALTGHVVLSTLHTNDAAGAIPRLIDMGIEPFLITSSTNVVLAQRLVRKLCEHCKFKVKIPAETLQEIQNELKNIPANDQPKTQEVTLYAGKGCRQCNDSGYKGRFGIFEVLSVTETIKQMALKRVSASELTELAIKEGMITMKQDGLLKAMNGETSFEEVWRVTKD